MNRFSAIGHLSSDVEILTGGSGDSAWKLAKFRIAVVHKHGKKVEGQKKREGEETAFIPCKAWKNGLDLAGTAEKYLKKGDRVGIEGRFNTETWEDKETGKNKSMLVLTVDQITLLGEGNGSSSNNKMEERLAKLEALLSGNTTPAPQKPAENTDDSTDEENVPF